MRPGWPASWLQPTRFRGLRGLTSRACWVATVPGGVLTLTFVPMRGDWRLVVHVTESSVRSSRVSSCGRLRLVKGHMFVTPGLSPWDSLDLVRLLYGGCDTWQGQKSDGGIQSAPRVHFHRGERAGSHGASV